MRRKGSVQTLVINDLEMLTMLANYSDLIRTVYYQLHTFPHCCYAYLLSQEGGGWKVPLLQVPEFWPTRSRCGEQTEVPLVPNG